MLDPTKTRPNIEKRLPNRRNDLKDRQEPNDWASNTEVSEYSLVREKMLNAEPNREKERNDNVDDREPYCKMEQLDP
jgi:hypothetical protein